MTSTELGYLSGVTSNIQDQLNGKVSNLNCTNTVMYSNVSNGWLMRHDLTDIDNNSIQIGFDKTTGIYAYVNSNQLWNIKYNSGFTGMSNLLYYDQNDNDGSSFKSALDSHLSNMAVGEIKHFYCSIYPYYSGSMYSIMLFKNTNEWSSLIGFSYEGHGDIIIMTKWDGVWQHIKSLNKYGDSLPYGKNAIGQIFFLKSN